jgi:hypothetical protein
LLIPSGDINAGIPPPLPPLPAPPPEQAAIAKNTTTTRHDLQFRFIFSSSKIKGGNKNRGDGTKTSPAMQTSDRLIIDLFEEPGERLRPMTRHAADFYFIMTA